MTGHESKKSKSKDAKESTIPKTFCQRWGTLMSIAVGISLSAALVVPMLLLTDTPCTTTQSLTRGEQLLCVAPSWAGAGNLEFNPGKGLSAYLFEEKPGADLTAPFIHDSLESSTQISSFSFASFSSWMLIGSVIHVSINASSAADVFYINETALDSFKYGEDFESLVKHSEVTEVAFDYTFTPDADQEQLQRLTVLIRNSGSTNININCSLTYNFTQLNFTGALKSCHDEESCSFDDIQEGLIMIAVAHENFTDGKTRLTMGWSYKANAMVTGVVVVIVVFVLVVTTESTLIGVNQKKSRREALERRQLSSEASGITPTPSITPMNDF